jgi:hypothetical protein
MKKRRIGVVDYEAKIEPFMERFIKIYGRLRYDGKQIGRMIRRARAKRPLPKDAADVLTRFFSPTPWRLCAWGYF